MDKIVLLYAILLTGLIFLVIPNTVEPVDFFILSDMKIHGATHVYFICERLVMIGLAYIIAAESKEYKTIVWAFFYLCVADLVDYLVSYNEIWFTVGSVPVSMNVMKVIVFGFVIVREWKLK